jgi:putative ABC transport system substrate-binding protein
LDLSSRTGLPIGDRNNPDFVFTVTHDFVRAGAGAVLLLTSSVSFNNRARVAALALKHHLPSMFGFREGPEAGGLLSYGPDVNTAFRRCAVYVDKIIKGAKPSEPMNGLKLRRKAALPPMDRASLSSS